jgi:hypothetical protein
MNMNMLHLPDEYFQMKEMERIDMANHSMNNIKDVVKESIENTDKHFIIMLLETKVQMFVNEEEYEQAEFMNNCIKYINNNF